MNIREEQPPLELSHFAYGFRWYSTPLKQDFWVFPNFLSFPMFGSNEFAMGWISFHVELSFYIVQKKIQKIIAKTALNQ